MSTSQSKAEENARDAAGIFFVVGVITTTIGVWLVWGVAAALFTLGAICGAMWLLCCIASAVIHLKEEKKQTTTSRLDFERAISSAIIEGLGDPKITWQQIDAARRNVLFVVRAEQDKP